MAGSPTGYEVDLSKAYVDATVTLADYLVVVPVAAPLIMAALCLMLRRHQDAQPVLAAVTLAGVITPQQVEAGIFQRALG